MREAAFIQQNAEKWQAYETTPTANPDEFSERFVELTDDLSFAKTFYPQSPVTKYLNGLASVFHRKIYANKKEQGNRFIRFWAYELPKTFYHSHKTMVYSTLFFFVAAAIGSLSAMYDETYVRLILGDRYVNMTIENIKSGDPMAVYKSDSSTEMFLGITINNIMVALRAFVFGIFLSVGTVYIIFYNGIMLGAFFTFLFKQGVIQTALLTVWIHGTLEISAIIIAGCAGMTLGNSILFPETYTRMHSFQQGAKQGLKIAIGLIPIFIVAGFLESFVTRQPLYWWASLGVILASGAFIIWYFIVYPIQLNRKHELH